MKIFTLVLCMTFNVICSNAQVLQNSVMLSDEEMSQNVLTLPVFANQSEIQRNFIELNKITRMEVYQYEVKDDGKVDSTLVSASNFIYNNKNRIIEKQNFDKQQSLVSKIFFYYDDLNMLIKESYSKKHDSDYEIDNINFTYNKRGQKEYTTYYNRDTSFLTVIKNVYDDSNRVVKHLQKTEASNKILSSATQKLSFEALKRVFKVDEFQITDTLLYNSENKVIKVENYGLAHDTTSAYLIDYSGVDPAEITITKQTKRNNYVIEKMRINRLNQILFISIAPEDTVLADYDARNDKIEKLSYNMDGTLSRSIGYKGKKVKHIYKFVYKKQSSRVPLFAL